MIGVLLLMFVPLALLVALVVFAAKERRENKIAIDEFNASMDSLHKGIVELREECERVAK